MISVIFALCALAATFSACRHFAAKALLVRSEIDKASQGGLNRAERLSNWRSCERQMRSCVIFCWTFWKTKQLFQSSQHLHRGSICAGWAPQRSRGIGKFLLKVGTSSNSVEPLGSSKTTAHLRPTNAGLEFRNSSRRVFKGVL